MHDEPDNDGDAIHGFKVAFAAEAIVALGIFISVLINLHAIEQVFAWAE